MSVHTLFFATFLYLIFLFGYFDNWEVEITLRWNTDLTSCASKVVGSLYAIFTLHSCLLFSSSSSSSISALMALWRVSNGKPLYVSPMKSMAESFAGFLLPKMNKTILLIFGMCGFGKIKNHGNNVEICIQRNDKV